MELLFLRIEWQQHENLVADIEFEETSVILVVRTDNPIVSDQQILSDKKLAWATHDTILCI